MNRICLFFMSYFRKNREQQSYSLINKIIQFSEVDFPNSPIPFAAPVASSVIVLNIVLLTFTMWNSIIIQREMVQ